MNYRNPIYTADGKIDCEIEHPAFGWIPTTLSPDDPETADLFAKVKSEGAVAPINPVPLDVLAKQALRRINNGYQAEMRALLRTYPQAETMTFDKQEREAREWQADATAATPLIDTIATARNMDKAELVSRIIAKADAWIEASGYATGKRQGKEDRIAKALAVEDRETLLSIAW